MSNFVKGRNFWYLDQFNVVVDQIEAGKTITGDCVSLIRHLARTEEKAAEQIKDFMQRWERKLTDSKEYDTSLDAWHSLLINLESRHQQKIRTKDELTALAKKLSKWKKKTYRQQLLGGSKIAQEIKRKFENIQNDWVNVCNKRKKTNRAYRELAQQLDEKGEESQTVSEQEALEKKLEEYDIAKEAVKTHQPIYIEKMEEAYKAAMEHEGERKKVMKEVFENLYKITNATKDSAVSLAHEKFFGVIEKIDIENDLREFNRFNGPAMSNRLPTFDTELDLYTNCYLD